MASYTTAWVIGSMRDLSYQSFLIAGNGTVEIVGDFYLWHATNAISLLDEFVVQMTAAGVTTPAAYLTRDRRVRLTAGANFTVDWSSDTGLRTLLGFTGNLSGAATYTATNVSPLLFSPRKPILPGLSPLDCLGNERPLAYWTASPSDGTPFVVSHGTRTDQTFTASHVPMARMQTTAEAGGEWVTLFNTSLALGYYFYVYPEAVEETSSTTDTTSTLTGGLGPYVLSPSGRAPSWDFRRARGLELLNTHADWSVACRVVENEYT